MKTILLVLVAAVVGVSFGTKNESEKKSLAVSDTVRPVQQNNAYNKLKAETLKYKIMIVEDQNEIEKALNQ